MTASPLSEAAAGAARPWWRTLTRYQWFVFAIASSAWLFDTLDQRLFSLARIPALADLAQLPSSHLEVQSAAKVATAVFLVGWGLGGLTAGALGDRYGRARLLAFSILGYALGSALTALSRTPFEFIVLRLFTGLGIGGVFGLAVSIISDTLSGGSRVAALAALQVLSAVGNVIAAFIKMGVDWLASLQLIATTDVWRVVFLIGALPLVLGLLAVFGLREPESWSQLKSENRLPQGAFGAYMEIARSREARRNLIVGTALSVAGVVGLWAIGEFAVDLQDAVFTLHYAKTEPALRVAALVAQAKNVSFMLQMAGGALGMLVFASAARRLGRRPAFLASFLIAFIVTVYVYWRLETPADALWMMPLMGAAHFSVFAGFAIYLPELFESRVRATGVSFAYNFGRFAAAAGSFGSALLTTRVFGELPAPLPLRYSAMSMGVVFLLGVVAAWYAPETRGQELRE